MKVSDILTESMIDSVLSSEDDINPDHITSKSFLDVLRKVGWPGAKFYSGGQARNNKTSRVIPIGVEVTQDLASAQKWLQKCNDAVTKAFPGIKYTLDANPNFSDRFYWMFKVELQGLSKERLDFINACKALVKQYRANGKSIDVWTENRKDGAYVSVSLGSSATWQVANTGQINTDEIDEFVDELIEKYGERLEVHPGTWSTKVKYV